MGEVIILFCFLFQTLLVSLCVLSAPQWSQKLNCLKWSTTKWGHVIKLPIHIIWMVFVNAHDLADLLNFLSVNHQADRCGPDFSSVYNNTEQMINVSSCSSSHPAEVFVVCMSICSWMVSVRPSTWVLNFPINVWNLFFLAFLTGDECFTSGSLSLQVTFTSLDVMLHTEALLSALNFLSTALSSSSMPSSEKNLLPKAEERTASAKSS